MARRVSTVLPEALFGRLAELRRRLTTGMHGSLGVIQDLDLTLAQAMALTQLSERGPLTVSALQTAAGRSQAATSHLVEQLEQRRLVQRRVDPEDRRRRVVQLAPGGRNAVAKIEAVRRAALESVLGEVPPPVLRRLDDALRDVLASLD
ncbi:MAG: MarR family transcriptional regulator [Myxococcota bacterium]